MQVKLLFAALVAAAFALPATANTDKAKSTSAPSSSTAAANDGGADAMFTAMDKNKDGFISKDEAKGTPHEAQFDTLDKNHDGKLSREEHYNAPEHVAARNKGDKTSSASDASTSASAADTSSSKKY